MVRMKEYNVLESYISNVSLLPTFLVMKYFFYPMVCIRCVRVVHLLGNGYGKRAYMSMVTRLCENCRKRHGIKIAVTTEKQDEHPYLKIQPDWFEQYCFPVMYNSYALTLVFLRLWRRPEPFIETHCDTCQHYAEPLMESLVR